MNDIEKKRNGWSEQEKYVLKTLEELKEKYECSDNKIDDLKLLFVKEFSEIKSEIKLINSRMTIKSTLVGLLGGLIPALTVLLWFIISNKT